jgi:hypothetical protein
MEVGCGGYKALRARVSRHVTAKLSRPKADGVNPAAVRGTSPTLPGEVSPYA